MSDSSVSVPHDRMANAIRALAMDAVQAAKSGHPGMPMGMADAATVLFTQFLKFDPQRPDWPDRDRFVLSAGHGSMLLYAVLHLTGYPDMTMAELRNFRQLHSRTAGHPEYGAAPGIETTTGPLGQGLANAVGMALAERMMNARFGDDLVDHRTWAVAGDGCLMEGISQEAITLAGHLGLGRLIVLFDDNEISIDGPTGLATSDNQAGRFEACGWHVQTVDGHDPTALAAAMQAACDSDRPSMIACRTVIGYGAPTKAGTAATHGAPLGEDEIAGARERLDWRHPPFEIPAEVAEAWRTAGARGAANADAWEARLAAADEGVRAAFRRVTDGALPAGLGDAVNVLKQQFATEAPKMATRQASGKVLDRLTQAVPELAGGSADLTGSNNTRAAGHSDIAAGDFSGGYIRYGVREHGMAAAMNGMALHGGLIPYGGTFLVFTDYARPAIRLSALMEQRVIYVMTHDSIGLGEDGPTHQPVEHLAALRAMPNLNVFRPCDAVEVAECWELALQARETPSVLALTRQGLPTLRTEHRAENACARGAYVLAEAGAERQATLLASGSEVSIAVEAQALLKAEGIEAAVVSMPCWELFERQPDDYRASVLGDAPRIACEAASGFGWTRWTGDGGGFVGMKSFGASAPAPHLYEHFGVTAAAVADAARTIIAGRG
ncbi:MAG: transketolase [Rhodospirillaceae bacterium]|nr:transketolase [Rhodospirillaceae bacterium]MYH38258.1 transketolase [Rhodospirillaceae bacterium]MYK14369.1 transketolase [Rhodospirillaceae bacterium]MYK58167.1 transketolase [Rhodospirillaceae bacterium]